MPEYFGRLEIDELSKKWLQDRVNEGAIVETSISESQAAWVDKLMQLDSDYEILKAELEELKKAHESQAGF